MLRAATLSCAGAGRAASRARVSKPGAHEHRFAPRTMGAGGEGMPRINLNQKGTQMDTHRFPEQVRLTHRLANGLQALVLLREWSAGYGCRTTRA